MKNPTWKRDEIILALNLYFKLKPGEIHARNPKIIELSEILNELPIHNIDNKNQKFRNSNGVSLKLSNFLALDPDYEGKGMQSFSKLDKQVFEEFKNNRNELDEIAIAIKSVVKNIETRDKLYKIHEDATDQVSEVKEGKILYKLHKSRERDPKIIKKKKEDALRKYGKLDCEICGFNFEEKYGEIGKEFIECHHIVPLKERIRETKTSLKDLILVCSNCHRMLHNKISEITIKELKMKIKDGSS